MAYKQDKGVEASDTSALNELAKVLNSKRGVCLLIKNQSASNLVNPQICTTSGKIQGTLPFEIRSGQHACIGFHKTFLSMRGAVGVVTYDIEDSDKRLCIFYCNPYLGYNSFGLAWKRMANSAVSVDLCTEFFPDDKRWFSYGNHSWHEVTEYGFTAAGFMDQGDPGYLHVHVKNHDV